MKNRRSTERKMKSYTLFEKHDNGSYTRVTGHWKIWASNLGSARYQAQHQMFKNYGSIVGLSFAVVIPDDRPHLFPNALKQVSKITESTFYIWHRNQNKSYSGYELEQPSPEPIPKPTISIPVPITKPLPVSVLLGVGEVLKSQMMHYGDKLREAVKDMVLSRNTPNRPVNP